MRYILGSALFFLTLSADAQILTPDVKAQRHDSRDPYYRDDPYYGDDREMRRERRRERRDRRGDYGYGNRRRDDYGYGRNDDYGRSRDYGYGYGGDPMSVASRVMSDVRMVASNNYGIEKHDRKHFEEVEEELGKFTRKYREGKYDKNNLKDAAESLRHLAGSQQIRSSRDRRILSDSLRAVEELRSGNYDSYSRSRSNGSIWDVLGGR